MKILHLISGGDVGGAKTHVLSLLNGLGKTETVRLVCFTDGEFADDARALGVETVIMRESVPSCIHRLTSMITEEHFEIVHCHGARANMIGSILRRKTDVPNVTTVHSDYRLDYMGRPLHRLTYGTINTVCLRLFDYHIGVSDAMAQLLISRGFDPQTMFSIYNGVEFSGHDPAVSRNDYLRSLGMETDDSTVVFGIAARLNPVKDIGTLISAFSLAVKQYPNMRLVIAGDGEQNEMLRQQAASSCPEGTVCFAGWVTDTDSFYGCLDVNTLTSLSETFPYALTEGARQCCATIATNVGGIPYLIESGVTGLLFEPKDVPALANHMVHLATDSEFRRQLGQNLYEKASSDFSVDATVSKQLDIYRTIIRKKKTKRQKKSGVIICGAYGKGNAGDEAILKAILRQMKHVDPDMPVCVLSHAPMQTKLQYHVNSVHVFNPFAFLPAMRRAKLYLSGGGSLIQNETSTRSLYYYLTSIRLARLCGCRILMYGCGIGPVKGSFSRRTAARVIDRYVDAIALREDKSALELDSMGVSHPEIYITADPALLLEAGSFGAVDSFLLGHKLNPDGAYAMFVLRPWKDFSAKKQALISAAEYVRSECGLTPVFFALEPGRDLAACREIAEGLPFETVTVTAPADEKLIIGMMKKMKIVISMRLHTLIFASGAGTPLVALSYDPKVSGFMEYIGQKHCMPFEDVEADSLCRLIREALSDPMPYSVEHLRSLAEENETIARKLMEEK